MPFTSPSWRSLNPLKGSLNHPKKVTLNHQAHIFSFFLPFLIILLVGSGGGGLETCWESCASEYTLGGAHQPFPPHKCLSRQHLPARNRFQLVQPPFGGDAGETLQGGQATAEKKRHSRISRIESQPKKNRGDMGSSCSNCKRNGVCFQRSSRKLARNCVYPGSPKTSF